jgi:hypothetical protein
LVVCTVQFLDVIEVLHAFQKKSKNGIATPRQEVEKVKMRLKAAADKESLKSNNQRRENPATAAVGARHCIIYLSSKMFLGAQ